MVRQLCTVCDEKEGVCLDFHHLDEKKKDFALSNSSTHSFDTIKREIAKCILVCSNCHRKIHAGLIICKQEDLIKIEG